MNRRIPRVLTALCAAVVAVAAMTIGSVASADPARTWYVHNGGHDTNICDSTTSTCETIAGAMAQASPGDIIVVGDGTYSDPVTISEQITIDGWPSQSPDITAPVTVTDGGAVTLSGLGFSGDGRVEVDDNTSSTTISDNSFNDVTGPAIALNGPSAPDVLTATVSGNTGSVPAGAQPIVQSGNVAVTTNDQPNSIAVDGASVDLSGPPSPPTDLTTDESPTTVSVSASAGTALDNARLDVGVVADASAASSPVGITVQDGGNPNSITLTGSNGVFAGALTSAAPLAADGALSPDVRVAALSASATAPAVTLSLDEIVGGDVLNTVASSHFSPTLHANSPPAYDDETVTIAHGDSSVDVTLAATDVDGDAMHYDFAQPAAGNGTVAVGADDHHLVYTAPSGGLTSAITFTYTVTDGNSDPATKTITVNPAPNSVPSYTGQTLTLAHGTSSIDIVLSATDGDAGDTLTYSHTQPTTGTGTVSQGADDHHLTYHAPPGGLTSAATFTYAVTDGYSNPASQTITVNPAPNSVPSYTGQTLTLAHGTSNIDIVLSATDGDAGDTLTYSHTQPTTGTGTVSQGADDHHLTYHAPPGGLTSAATFTYAVTDGYSNPASQTIMINPAPNAVPVLDTASQSITLDVPVFSTQNITVSASDPDDDLLTYTASNTALHKVSANKFAYTAPATAVGHTFNYTVTVSDPYGGEAVSHIAILVVRATSQLTWLSMSPRHPSSADHPTVTVHVKSAGTELRGVVTIRTGGFGTPSARVNSKGNASIRLPQFPGGPQSITAVFGGTRTAAPDASNEYGFTVTKVASKIAFKTSPLQLTTSTSNATATVTVTAGPFHPSGGTVTIDENGNRLAQGTPKVGVITLHLPRFSLGQHNLTVSYTGTTSIAASSVIEIERVGLG